MTHDRDLLAKPRLIIAIVQAKAQVSGKAAQPFGVDFRAAALEQSASQAASERFNARQVARKVAIVMSV